MSALPLRSTNTADLLNAPAPPLRPATAWPYPIAVPLIMLASLALWAILWQTAAYIITTLMN